MHFHIIAPFNESVHRAGVTALWRVVFRYETSHNDPDLVIHKKLAIKDGLFFIALSEATVIGSIMAGYDGHRGWLYSLAVLPSHRHNKVGSALVHEAERVLTGLGCMKINLQIMQSNESVQGFYTSLGYTSEERVSMGKRIPENIINTTEQGAAANP